MNTEIQNAINAVLTSGELDNIDQKHFTFTTIVMLIEVMQHLPQPEGKNLIQETMLRMAHTGPAGGAFQTFLQLAWKA